jgi:hypothetical protein
MPPSSTPLSATPDTHTLYRSLHTLFPFLTHVGSSAYPSQRNGRQTAGRWISGLMLPQYSPNDLIRMSFSRDASGWRNMMRVWRRVLSMDMRNCLECGQHTLVMASFAPEFWTPKPLSLSWTCQVTLIAASVWKWRQGSAWGARKRSWSQHCSGDGSEAKVGRMDVRHQRQCGPQFRWILDDSLCVWPLAVERPDLSFGTLLRSLLSAPALSIAITVMPVFFAFVARAVLNGMTDTIRDMVRLFLKFTTESFKCAIRRKTPRADVLSLSASPATRDSCGLQQLFSGRLPSPRESNYWSQLTWPLRWAHEHGRHRHDLLAPNVGRQIPSVIHVVAARRMTYRPKCDGRTDHRVIEPIGTDNASSCCACGVLIARPGQMGY